MFLVNSRLGLFTAACFRRHPFFRSYGVNMPSSLTTLLPLALGFSPHPPVSVSSSDRLRIIYRICIDYAFRPRLSPRLTLGGRTFPRKPWIFGHYDSHAILATHSGILSSRGSTCPCRSCFAPAAMLLYRWLPPSQSFGGVFQPRSFSAQDLSTSELLRTL